MAKKNKKGTNSRTRQSDDARRDSGSPGGGAGRRDEVGPTGVYPMSGGLPRGKHPEIRTPASWGQGERGAAGYEDSGRSGLVWKDGQLLGGLSADSSSEPTGDTPLGARTPDSTKAQKKTKPAQNAPLRDHDPERDR